MLVTTGERILAAEFPAAARAVDVLDAIGSGEDRFTTIAAVAEMQQAVLARSLRLLVRDKRVVAMDEPVSLQPRRAPGTGWPTSTCFWWRFVRPDVDDIARGRGDIALRRWQDGWAGYRGKAIEPLVRDALLRLARDGGQLPASEHVGGWWTRTRDAELDLVGVGRWSRARRVAFVGSVMWRERAAFDRRDPEALARQRASLNGAADAPMIAVSRSGAGSTVWPPRLALRTCSAHGALTLPASGKRPGRPACCGRSRPASRHRTSPARHRPAPGCGPGDSCQDARVAVFVDS